MSVWPWSVDSWAFFKFEKCIKFLGILLVIGLEVFSSVLLLTIAGVEVSSFMFMYIAYGLRVGRMFLQWFPLLCIILYNLLFYLFYLSVLFSEATCMFSSRNLQLKVEMLLVFVWMHFSHSSNGDLGFSLCHIRYKSPHVTLANSKVFVVLN